MFYITQYKNATPNSTFWCQDIFRKYLFNKIYGNGSYFILLRDAQIRVGY